MRTLACAQCHVEYYFTPEGKYLTFPWHNGTTMEGAEQYYDEIGFADYTHALSKAPIIKAQHPDYEIFSTGIHAQRGVSCADCHMPFMREDGRKYTSLNNQTFFFVFLVLSQFFTLITLGHFFGKTMSTGRDVDLGYGK